MQAEAAHTSDDLVWAKRMLLLAAGLLSVRIAYLAITPLDLVPDEAYYWDWSRRPDWCYYSKPPVVAWLIGLSTWIGGSTGFFVRLPAALLATGTLGFVYVLGRDLFDRRTGFWAAALMAATPGNTVGSILMTIDAPLVFFWSAALWCVWHLIRSGHALWLSAAILSTGLGLLSKQTMLGFIGLTLVFVLWCADIRRAANRWRLSAWVVGSLSFLTPVVWWNAQHDWITLTHTRGHFDRPPDDIWDRLSASAEYLGAQIGLLSPLTWLLALLVMVRFVRQLRQNSPAEAYLFCTGLLPLLGVFGLSLVQRVQPNWPAPFYVSTSVLVAGVCCARGPQSSGSSVFSVTWLHRSVFVGAVCAAVTYLLPIAATIDSHLVAKIDLTVRLRGWEELGRQASVFSEQLPDPENAILIGVTDRHVLSELAFYLERQPRAFLWNPTGRVESQYDVWPDPAAHVGADALIVTFPDRDVPEELRDRFTEIADRGVTEVRLSSQRSRRYRFWTASGLKGWPQTDTVIP